MPASSIHCWGPAKPSQTTVPAGTRSGADLNAYSKIEAQGGCCSPTTTAGAPKPAAATGGGCCGGTPAPCDQSQVHDGLADVLRRYDVNEYAASVKVYAVKPR